MTNPANARTDAETGLRYYKWHNTEYPSVTSIRRLIGMPFSLHNYALSQVIERAVVDHELIGTMLARPKRPRERVRDKNVITEVKKHLRAAATEERDLAGDIGTAVHDAIHAGIDPDDPSITDLNVRARLWQFRDFWQTCRPTLLFAEQQVWNLKYGYAGTPDAMLALPNGRRFVVDYKTGGGVYIDHATQVTAYSMADFVERDGIIDVAATAQLLNADGLAVLHLANNYWEWIEVVPEPDTFRAFIGALAMARWLEAHDNKIDTLVSSRQKGGTLVPALKASIEAIHQRQSIPTIPLHQPEEAQQ